MFFFTMRERKSQYFLGKLGMVIGRRKKIGRPIVIIIGSSKNRKEHIYVLG